MKLPQIGFGTWQLEEGEQAYRCAKAALETGYRLIDTAMIYGNEASVGRAIRDSHVPREDIFVTTKLWTSDFCYDSAKEAFSESLERLGLDYIDLYLIHWPGQSGELRKQSWKALEEIKRAGKAKQIGVSNYEIHHLEELTSYAKQKPYANQIEFHPFVYEKQKPILEYCQKHAIVVEAYSPLAQAHKLNNPTLVEIADKYKVTPAQVMLQWAIAHQTIPLPRSSNPGRIKDNLDIGGFKLSDAEVERINELNNGRSVLG